jgi:hypothetical protein
LIPEPWHAVQIVGAQICAVPSQARLPRLERSQQPELDHPGRLIGLQTWCHLRLRQLVSAMPGGCRSPAGTVHTTARGRAWCRPTVSVLTAPVPTSRPRRPQACRPGPGCGGRHRDTWQLHVLAVPRRARGRRCDLSLPGGRRRSHNPDRSAPATPRSACGGMPRSASNLPAARCSDGDRQLRNTLPAASGGRAWVIAGSHGRVFPASCPAGSAPAWQRGARLAPIPRTPLPRRRRPDPPQLPANRTATRARARNSPRPEHPQKQTPRNLT